MRGHIFPNIGIDSITIRRESDGLYSRHITDPHADELIAKKKEQRNEELLLLI